MGRSRVRPALRPQVSFGIRRQFPRQPLGRGTAAPLGDAGDPHLAISRLIGLWPHELADDSPAARHKVLAKLRRALREERRRGLAGHWTYDLARHVELLRVYREALAAFGRNAPAALRR
jgi:hypothetical protein